ncbi:MAG: mannose-1-phosphate guanylyltransferase/mannose-6-phosphate isomerase [Methanomicrobiales archaeon]|nr:mannose-1-phosphate guanylyltransferase/mannose-6-phosphate isomerase [Methanomicrobiales archaeon]
MLYYRMDLFSLILAGGVGTRLWPLSREYYPKQFLPLDGRSLFQETFRRASLLSGPEQVLVVTSRLHQYLVRNQLEEVGVRIPEDHLLQEPEGKNTLPAIAWGMTRVREEQGEATVAVFPSDHVLGDGAVEEIRRAGPLAGEYLVTFGIPPARPHTGYGYILPGKALPLGAEVAAFREKPDQATAERYVREGYLWNSGIFLLSTGIFFRELETYQPTLARAFRGGEPDYFTLPAISIDYGLLERSARVAVVPLRAPWSDLGDFRAIAETQPQDARGNSGTAEFIDAENTFVRAPGKHVGVIGTRDLVVVDTPDALLVCHRAMTGKVRDLVQRYEARGDPITQFHTQVHRPWGSYTVLEEAKGYKIKRVTVNPGKRLSLQLHRQRSEHWIVVTGTAEIDLGGRKLTLSPNESTFVPAGTRHRLANPGRVPLEVIEVQSGGYLGEDDIVRFDDEYGRS